MYNFKIIEASDQSWSQVISSSYQYDFYHTQSYAKLEKKNRPFLCVAYFNNDFIAMPLILRAIEGTCYFDCTSMYGYCGPVCNLPYENIPKELILFFQSELLSFFKKNSVVSAFSRLHPVFNQHIVLENFGSLRAINPTLAIDLTLPEEDQYKKYRKNHRKDIEKLIRNNFRITEATTILEIDFFIKMYYELMKRLEAHKSYFFDRDYFYSFLNNPCFKGKLLLVKVDNEIAAGGLFSITQNIMQAHLTCDHIKYRNYAPLKLIIDFARKLGTELKLEYLHLGGGRHGCSNDSLFHFKAGFTDKRFTFSSWEIIIDEPKYNFLVKTLNSDNQNDKSYFPSFRNRED